MRLKQQLHSLLAAAWLGLAALAPFSQVPTADAQPPATNRVLELDGKGAYVELPARVFDGLEECTVEGWVKWQSFRYWSRFFEVGRGSWQGFNVGQSGIEPTLSAYFPSEPAEAGVEQIHAPSVLRVGEWGHVALVISRDQVTLLYNGQAVASGRLRGGLQSLPVKERFVLGRNNWGTFGAPGVVRPEETVAPTSTADKPTQSEGLFEDFHGQMDEVRVWRVARSAEEIRRTMTTRLAGSETNLVALWNFDDGSASDATGRFHGQYRRQARAIEAEFPAILPGVRLQPVLLLDGLHSYAELPPGIFQELKESTVEAWIQCDGLQPEGEARFFEVGQDGEMFSISPGLWGADASSAVVFTIVSGQQGPVFHNAWAKNVIRPGRWFHLAAVSGEGGMRFYLNGVLVATNSYPGSFASTRCSGPTRLGKTIESNKPAERTLRGQLADVRVWGRQRTGDEIGRDMFRLLRGDEAGLVGLWDFADDTPRDRSPHQHHGQLKGNATILSRLMPVREELEQPATLVLTAVDEGGNPLPGAQFDVLQSGQTVASVTVDEVKDNRQLVLFPNQRPYEIRARRSEIGATQRDLELRPGEIKEVRMVLKRSGAISGTVRTFADTPHTSVVVQALDSTGRSAKTALTDAAGNYRLEELPLGEYQVRCHVLGGLQYHIGPGRSEFRSTTTDASTTNVARRVIVAPGRTEVVDFQFAPFKKGTWRNYKTRDGLPHNIVCGIDPDAETGNLWLVGGGGLTRFDGGECVTFTAATGVSNTMIRSMLRDPKGVFWLGTESGLVRYDSKTGQVKKFTQSDGLLSNMILALARDASDRIWVGCWPDGVSRLDGTQFTNFTVADGLGAGGAYAIVSEPDGVIWFGTWGGASRYDGTRFQNFTVADGLPDNTVTGIYRDGHGSLWFGTRRGFSRFDGKSFANVRGTEDLSWPGYLRAIHRDADGVMWFGAGTWTPVGGGVWRYDGKSLVHFGKEDGLPADSILDIQSDSDGAIWFACWGGLARYDPKTFVNFTEADGMADRSVRRIHAAPDQTLWFGGFTRGGITSYDQKEFRIPAGGEGLRSGGYGAAIRTDSDGALWFGTWDDGLFRYDGTRFHPVKPQSGPGPGNISGIEFDPDGSLWITARGGGLWRYDRTNFSNVSTNIGLAETEDLISAHRDRNGVLWLGGLTTGLGRYDGRQLIRVSAREGLMSESILCISQDSDGQLWFGTTHGAFRYDGERFDSFTKAHGQLAADIVVSIFHDSRGVHWFAGDAGVGVTRYDGAIWSSVDERDGLAHQDTLDVAEAPPGTFWIGTNEGLTRYQPGTHPSRQPRIKVRTDRAEYTSAAAVPTVTARERVVFMLGVSDFKSRPDNRLYRYRVTSGDASQVAQELEPNYRKQFGWSAAIKDSQIEWSTNQPGTYTFEFQFIDRDLNYSKPTLATLTIVPPWYLNAKIAGPMMAGNLGLIVWAFVARLLYRAKRREAERLKAQMLAQEQAARATLEAKNAQLESAKLAVEAKAAQLVESNTQLAAAKDAADAANKAKSLFLANMSHEIRTPMNAILGYSQILRRDHELPPKYRPSIETIEKSGDHLLAMINDILDLSKIEAGRMELQESDFDLGSLVQGLAEMFRVRCEEKQLELRVEWGSAESGVRSAESESATVGAAESGKVRKWESGTKPADGGVSVSPAHFPTFPPAPLPVRGDEGKLRQVLINLLGNAVKFTERGGVTLRLESRLQPVGASDTLTGQKGSGETHAADRLKAGLRTYRFEIIDTGKGISPENQRDLFQPFQQGTEGRNKGGTGLGLAITKRQVEFMGGTIGVESQPGQGSRFFFDVPLAPAQSEIVAREEQPAREVLGLAPGVRVRVLVVDDVRQNREVLSQLLAGIGCEVTLADGGLVALEQLRAAMPDIVFMDIRMPDLDGPEVVGRIFAEFGRGRTKLVAISASVFAHEQQSYLDAGFDAFVGKPFRFEEVCAVLGRLLNVEFRYAEEEEKTAPATAALDPATVTLPEAVLIPLREAAARYSVTRLEKDLSELEQNGETGRAVAAYLRRLVRTGDLDGVSGFLEKVKQTSGVGEFGSGGVGES
ncbi:MAG: response regulator [Verrucomicrobia bacterium]|nr:response regulator [Verrucomicrobiota bacterium]